MQTASSLAATIGVGRTTLWRWQRAGLIPAPARNGREAIYSDAAVTAARSVAEEMR